MCVCVCVCVCVCECVCVCACVRVCVRAHECKWTMFILDLLYNCTPCRRQTPFNISRLNVGRCLGLLGLCLLGKLNHRISFEC